MQHTFFLIMGLLLTLDGLTSNSLPPPPVSVQTGGHR